MIDILSLIPPSSPSLFPSSPPLPPPPSPLPSLPYPIPSPTLPLSLSLPPPLQDQGLSLSYLTPGQSLPIHQLDLGRSPEIRLSVIQVSAPYTCDIHCYNLHNCGLIFQGKSVSLKGKFILEKKQPEYATFPTTATGSTPTVNCSGVYSEVVFMYVILLATDSSLRGLWLPEGWHLLCFLDDQQDWTHSRIQGKKFAIQT